jgi:hypothetical protein
MFHPLLIAIVELDTRTLEPHSHYDRFLNKGQVKHPSFGHPWHLATQAGDNVTVTTNHMQGGTSSAVQQLQLQKSTPKID